MTSSLLCAQTGIDNPEIFGNSASYIAGWLSALNDDKRLVITAAAQAQHATDLIASPERQAAKGNEQRSRSPASRQQNPRRRASPARSRAPRCLATTAIWATGHGFRRLRSGPVTGRPRRAEEGAEPVTLVPATRMLKLATIRVTAVVTSWPRHLSNRVHRDGDALARRHGWEIVITTGRFGFNGRAYRDPRFAQLPPAPAGTAPVASTADDQNLGTGQRPLEWPGGRSG